MLYTVRNIFSIKSKKYFDIYGIDADLHLYIILFIYLRAYGLKNPIYKGIQIQSTLDMKKSQGTGKLLRDIKNS